MKYLVLTIVLCLSLPVCGPQTVEPATSTRLQYVLLNDTSGRTLWPKGIEQQVNMATQFLRRVVTPGSDLGSLVNFSEAEAIFLDVVNSTNPDDIATKLVRQGRGGTAVYDSLVSAAEWLSKQEPFDRRKVVFLFSDGDDDASKMSLKDAITAIQKLHIPVFVIAPSVVENKKPGKHMKQLAEATHGHSYFVGNGDSFDFAVLKSDLAR